MKSELSDVRRLINVKSIAYAKTPAQMVNGDLGIFPDGSLTSMVAGTTFATLPDKFRILYKYDGKLRVPQEDTYKAAILDQNFKNYQAELVNRWEGTLTACDCTKVVQVNINIDEDSLRRRDGTTWAHQDFYVEIAPSELTCVCDCTGKQVYDNNVMTRLLYKKITAVNSPFYTAKVKKSDGTALNTIADIDQFIADNKIVNTDANTTNDSLKLTLVIEGKLQGGKSYRDLDINYTYPRGVRISAVAVINGDTSITFTETQKLQYEHGAGYDLRDEEHRHMNSYTNLYYRMTNSDGTPSADLIYQFENGKNYDVINFQVDTAKVLQAGTNEQKREMITMAADAGSATSTQLKAIFVP